MAICGLVESASAHKAQATTERPTSMAEAVRRTRQLAVLGSRAFSAVSVN